MIVTLNKIRTPQSFYYDSCGRFVMDCVLCTCVRTCSIISYVKVILLGLYCYTKGVLEGI